MDGLSIISTDDGSHTIRNEILGETYHSTFGAIQESEHVFIASGLKYFRASSSKKIIRILEIGFGTGLNALLTYKSIRGSGVSVEYYSLETNPLTREIYSQLNYDEGGATFSAIYECEWDIAIPLFSDFTLLKMKQSVQAARLSDNFFDVVYFDAFAPQIQLDMWTLEIFEKIKASMASQSVLVTYCAKGQVKRDLKSAGFNVEKIPGPPGKREMIRATVEGNPS